jgi:uncharacterized membrane protein
MRESSHPQQGGQGEVRTARGLPRWPAAIALLAIGALYAMFSEDLRILPPFMLFVLVVVVLMPLLYAHRRGLHVASHLLGLSLVALATVAIAASVFLLAVSLPHQQTPTEALLNSGLIWLTNVVTFAVWYWEIDSGGPERRERDAYQSSDFLFPQAGQDQGDHPTWSPDFVDYLFLAFTTSTAFGPTDTQILSKQAKVLTMAQSFFSLLIIAVLVARATAQGP